MSSSSREHLLTPPPPRRRSQSQSPQIGGDGRSAGQQQTRPLPTPLQTLQQMGFSLGRAQKALAATGHRGVQVASDWLLAHANDPLLGDDAPRSYVVYLCPVSGLLQEQLQTFWDASKVQIGWNGAHGSLPHITILSAFQCPDSEVEEMVELIRKATEEYVPQFSRSGGCAITLERYQSPNFFGLFVGKKSEDLVRTLSQSVSRAVRRSTVSTAQRVAPGNSDASGDDVIDDKKPFHLTLAYQFSSAHFAGLQDLSAALNPSSECSWELRVYSFEARLKGQGVFEVIRGYEPRQEDELELRLGDFVHVEGKEKDEMRDSDDDDGWVIGTSWLTGCQGYLPKSYLQRTEQSKAWTLHLRVPMRGQDATMAPGTGTVALSSSPRQVFVCRHGERVDFTFGSWLPFCFDDQGRYTQRDLNMPATLPARRAGPQGFACDSPLTCMGGVQATMVGEALRSAGVKFAHAYSSPSLRCVQTCHHLLKGMGLDRLPIHLEPGLFEWMGWYQSAVPDWMSAQELHRAGFNVEERYKPYISAEELQDSQQETCEQYYTRNFFVSQCILQSTEEAGGNVLLLGHAATLDVCTRQMIGQAPRPLGEMINLIRKVPYCSIAVIGQQQKTKTEEKGKGSWHMLEPPVMPLTHGNNSRFDWKMLLMS